MPLSRMTKATDAYLEGQPRMHASDAVIVDVIDLSKMHKQIHIGRRRYISRS